ncbi:MAG: hypothetical protein K5983_04540, partial [Lactobacillus sp.]|nr:hypothetical protein [Lactobacillus sp.]
IYLIHKIASAFLGKINLKHIDRINSSYVARYVDAGKMSFNLKEIIENYLDCKAFSLGKNTELKKSYEFYGLGIYDGIIKKLKKEKLIF